MSLTTRVGLLAGVSALTLTGASFANETNTDSLRAEIAALRAEVAQLKTEDNWLTEQRADEIRGLVQDVLADADTRSSLLGNGMNAGYDGGFVIGSTDGNFKLKINGLVQFRFVYNNSEGGMAFLDQEMLTGDADHSFNDMGGAYAGFWADLPLFGPFLPPNFSVPPNNAYVNYYMGLLYLDVLFGGGLPNYVGFINTSGWIANYGNLPHLSFTNAGPGTGWAGIAYEDQQAWVDYMDGLLAGLPAPVQNWFYLNMIVLDPADPTGGTLTLAQFVNGGYPAAMQFAMQQWMQGQIQNGDNADNHRYGFDARRVRLKFSGHVVNPNWKYMIYGDFGNGDGNFDLLDAWIQYDFGNGWSLTFGQMTAPLLREQIVSASKQQAADRSMFNAQFTGGRTQGVLLDYIDDKFHFQGAFTDGANRRNTRWDVPDTDWAFTFRGEYIFAGDWKQFSDFTSPRGEEFGFMLGAAVHYEQGEFGTGTWTANQNASRTNAVGAFDNYEVENLTFTVDASMEFGGANLYGAFVYRALDTQTDFNWQSDLDQIGFVIQGGVYVTEDIELFGRFSYADHDMMDLTVPGDVVVYSWDDLAILTLGVNKYFSGHQVKWTTDFGYAFDRVEWYAANANLGWNSDTGGEDGQFVFRSQLQLTF